MGDYLERLDLWEAVGWVGQGCYFGRFLVQWLASERAGRIVVPMAFWWTSLAGSVFATVYAINERNLFFMAGPTVNFFIFARNIRLAHTGRPLGQGLLWSFALGIAVLATTALVARIRPDDPPVWLLIGTCGAALWMIRFPLQWYLSELRARATLPPVFFWISFAGSLLLLLYSFRTGNPIFIAGMILGPFLYARSLWLTYRPSKPT